MPEPAITGIRTFAGTDQSGPGHYVEPDGALRIGARYRVTTEHEGELRELTRDSDGDSLGPLHFVLLTDAGRIGGTVNVERQKWELVAPAYAWAPGDLAVGEAIGRPHARVALVHTADRAWKNLLNGTRLGDPDEWKILPVDAWLEAYS